MLYINIIMDDFEKIEYEDVEGDEIEIKIEDEKEQTTLDIVKDQGTQTYEEDFEGLDEYDLSDEMEKIGLEIIDGIKKGFQSLVIFFTDIKIDFEEQE